MRFSIKKPEVKWPRLSGPHVCLGAGQQALELARKSLMGAADMQGGKLGKDEIAAIFDLLAVSPELFEIFRANYEICGRIHKRQPFVSASKDFFAMSVLRFLCFDVLRSVFQMQIRRSKPTWEIEFLHALVEHICKTSNPEFVNELSEAYRRLAKTHGNTITAMTIASDEKIQDSVRRAVAGFPSEHMDYVNFSNAVNKLLSDKFEDYGPSPIKVSEPVIEEFFETLKESVKSNHFRKLVLS